MAGYIVAIMVGIIICVLGVMNMRGNISTLHFYHRQRVTEENIGAFGKLVGIGTFIIGLSVIICGVLSLIYLKNQSMALFILSNVFLAVGIIAGIILTFYAMIKYNGGIF